MTDSARRAFGADVDAHGTSVGETRPIPFATRPVLQGTLGMVAAGHYLAAAIGLSLLEKGGNAVDAGVAAGFAVGKGLQDRIEACVEFRRQRALAGRALPHREVLFASVHPAGRSCHCESAVAGESQIPIERTRNSKARRFCMEMNPGTVSHRIGAPPADSNVCSLV